MKKLYAAFMMLTIMVMTLPAQSVTISPSDNHPAFHDVGVYHNAVVTATSDANFTVNHCACAMCLHEAEIPTVQLRMTSPKLIKQSQYFGNSLACSKCLLNGVMWRNYHRQTNYDQTA